MKLLRVLFGVMFVAAVMTSCSDDSPTPTGAPTEDYNRAFIKEFGVPAKGRDYSTARSAGLKIKASRNTAIMVTAEVDGTEYLFANLTVPAGLTSVPATIPSDITSLNVYVYGEPYAVSPDATLDIDNLLARNQASRSIDFHLGEKYMNDGKPQPILYCKFSDFLEEYFEKYPIGEDIPCWGFEPPLPGWSGVGFYNAETKLVNNSNLSAKCYYLIFPIYIKSDDYTGTLLEESDGKTYSLGKPQDNLVTSTSIMEIGDIPNPIGFKNYGNNSVYQPDGRDRMIMSRGVRFQPDEAVYVHVESNQGISSSIFRENIRNWGDNYYPATLDNLYDLFACTRRYHLSKAAIQVYIDGSWKTYGDRTNSAFLIGFNKPPRVPNDTETIRDYSEVVYLVLMEDTEKLAEYQEKKPTYKAYEWMLAAEDLGGTFDWDFNDAVFKFTDVVENLVTVNTGSGKHYFATPTDITPVRKVTVTPMAAGGTMPLYITYTGKVSAMPDMPTAGPIDYYTANEALRASLNDPEEGTYVIGTEIHKWLGGSTYKKQLNTGEKVELPYGEPISFAIPTDATPSTERFAGGCQAYSEDNQPLYGFAVLVDKENKLNIDTRATGGVEYLPTHTIGQGAYLIGRPDETTDNVAPQMVMFCQNHFIEWPREYVNINDAYPYFREYITRNAPQPLWWNKNHDMVTHSDEHHDGK
ncbi:MAG: hypothetical protein K2G35_06320 [Duncaniella sp.]|nr:hypothetical protein [Duncaniella sp.]